MLLMTTVLIVMTVSDNDDVLSKDHLPDGAVVAGVRVLVLHPVIHEPFAWQQCINTKGDDSDSGHFEYMRSMVIQPVVHKPFPDDFFGREW